MVTGRKRHIVVDTVSLLLAVVKRKPNSHRFEVLPRRWVVERTLTWLTRCRRLSKDYEESTISSEAWAYIAIVHLSSNGSNPLESICSTPCQA